MADTKVGMLVRPAMYWTDFPSALVVRTQGRAMLEEFTLHCLVIFYIFSLSVKMLISSGNSSGPKSLTFFMSGIAR